MLDRKTGHVAIFVPLIDEEGAVIGEEETTPDDFGRIAAFAAKQVISQRLRDIADDAVLGEFRGKEGDIVAGVVQQGPNPRMVHVDLGSVEAILPPEEQVAGEEYAHGSRLRVYVTSVAKGTKGPQITVSRTHPGLVRKLFALEVPGDPRRARRDRLARARGGPPHQDRRPSERSDHQRQGRLHRRARPARPRGHRRARRGEDRHRRLRPGAGQVRRQRTVAGQGHLELHPGFLDKAVRALVPDYQLSLAIGKEGQNARLAAKLTGAKIDIQPDSVLES